MRFSQMPSAGTSAGSTAPPVSHTASTGATAPRERITNLDVIRGVAVLGILTMPQDSQADLEDQGMVASNEFGKRAIVVLAKLLGKKCVGIIHTRLAFRIPNGSPTS